MGVVMVLELEEATTRFSKEELADVMRRVAQREASREAESAMAGEPIELGIEDLEPLDSEAASFSLDAPPLKSLEGEAPVVQAVMPHVAQVRPLPEPLFTPQMRLSAGIGAGLACLCAGALWALWL